MKVKITGRLVKYSILAIILVMITTSCGSRKQKSGDGLRGNISVSGAFALYPMTVRWAEEFNKEYPDVRIDISAGGAGKGMADALSGMVDLGMFSRGISRAEKDKGVWWIAVAKDAVLPTINAKHPYLDQLKSTGLTLESFKKIFLADKPGNWEQYVGMPGNSTRIKAFTRSDACGAAQMWAEFLGSNQEDLSGIGVFGDPGMADAVKSDAAGIGYNNVVYVFDMNSRRKYPGIEVVPLDLNQNNRIDPDEDFYHTLDEVMLAISSEKYPSPPARELYFVSAGPPENEATIAFLNWILTSGQKFLSEAGYVNLTDENIRHQLGKLHAE